MQRLASRSNIPNSLISKIECLISYFNTPLPCLNFSIQNYAEVLEKLSDTLEEHRSKALKLIKITLTFQQLIENYCKNNQFLENFKESAEYQIDELEYKQEELVKETENLKKKLSNLNEYLENIEKNNDCLVKERDFFKQEISLIKKNGKVTESRLEKALSEERNQNLSQKTENFKKIEGLKNELIYREKCIEELNEKLGRAEKRGEEYEEMTQGFRKEVFKLKNDLFELKNKLSEEKIKKSNYKDLYKELVNLNGVGKRHIGVQTFDDECDLKEEINDLIELEDCSESINSFNLVVSKEISTSGILDLKNKENVIFVFKKKDGLEIAKQGTVYVQSNKKKLALGVGDNIGVKGEIRQKSSKIRCNSLNETCYLEKEKEGRQSEVIRKFGGTKLGIVKLSFFGVLNWRSKEETKKEEECFIYEPVKDYIFKVCDAVKHSYRNGEGLPSKPTKDLFKKVTGLRLPQFVWPKRGDRYFKCLNII